MSVTLDTILTVAIGRNQADGTPLPDRDWHHFQTCIDSILQDCGGTVVAHAVGDGLGSDSVNAGEIEESAIFIAVNVEDLVRARAEIASELPVFGQGSCCFAVDTAHQPVFSTKTGNRPVDDFLADSRARRTQVHA